MRRRILLSLACLPLAAVMIEVGFRVARERLGVTSGELRLGRAYCLRGEMRGFETRAYTSFQRPLALRGVNAFGFFDGEWKKERTPGVMRIMCLGASTTEGGNSHGNGGSYPFLLEKALKTRTGHKYEVLKAGISGWTSAEGLVSWFLCLQDFTPDLLVIHFAANDAEPRYRAEFMADYSHWRIPVLLPRPGLLEGFLLRRSDLFLAVKLRNAPIPNITRVTVSRGRFDPLFFEGRLSPETALPFRRNIRTVAEGARSVGARVVLLTMPMNEELAHPVLAYVVREHNRHLRELASEQGYLLADAERDFEARPELASEFLDSVHLSPAGNRAKAEVVIDVLERLWIPTLSSTEPESGRGDPK